MFKNAKTYTKQGDIGEARAIFEYTKMGFAVSRTIFDSERYDLIIDNGVKLYKVQVKTTNHISRCGIFIVTLCTSGGNKTSYNKRKISKDDCDEIFVLCSNGDCFIIPINEICDKLSINLGEKYKIYKIN